MGNADGSGRDNDDNIHVGWNIWKYLCSVGVLTPASEDVGNKVYNVSSFDRLVSLRCDSPVCYLQTVQLL
ncbi:hypothetical protein ACF0H5_008051 [Mactra antiquata]